ncbi:HAD hydrolase family protein [Halomonas sp. 18071143]|uniref:HAD hydrolase family protein n=1 Tax=Halomonas sp. 18071143 TaxID=2855441 RepID=UPI001C44FF38|nr:HAD hydrolase family protein [Halomonas sp. 18071143]
MKKLILDLDDTLCHTVSGDYKNSKPNLDLIDVVRKYKSQGFEIVIATARNMRTYEGNVGKINANTLPIIIGWLDKYDVPYDEVIVGKPWCGTEGFYVDDKAIRPNEFLNFTYEEIKKLVGIKDDNN